jgi:hypothetical protein
MPGDDYCETETDCTAGAVKRLFIQENILKFADH